MAVQSPGLMLDAGVLPLKVQDERLMLVDQRLLPEKLEYFDATALNDMCFAIRDMVVRGAPSIGVAAAFGMAFEAQRLASANPAVDAFLKQLNAIRQQLQSTRPTAVNLRWATDRIFDDILRLSETERNAIALSSQARQFAQTMLLDHIEINKRLSDYGADLVPEFAAVLTHCNAGALATCGWGTALGVIRSAALRGLKPTVYVDETRPRHQGSKLTVWELQQDRIPSTLICDSMSGHVMAQGKVKLVVTGADRIAANGDTANKIGTYNLAVVASFHKVPFYIAAPLSTFDSRIQSGAEIPIEERHIDEMTKIGDTRIAMEGVTVYNPAFDVTPASLIAGIITEVGVLRPPYESSIAQALLKMGDWRTPAS